MEIPKVRTAPRPKRLIKFFGMAVMSAAALLPTSSLAATNAAPGAATNAAPGIVWPCLSYDRAAGPGTFGPTVGLKAEIAVEATGNQGACTIRYKFSFNFYYINQGDQDVEQGLGIEDAVNPPSMPYSPTALPLHLRVWVCGKPKLDNDVLNGFTQGEIWWETQSWSYGSCGPQADDAFSNFLERTLGQGTTYINENGG